MAAIAWAISGLGMGLAYTTLSLLTLETAEAGREGAASATLQLTFTLGTAFGTGIGGAWVAAAATGVLSLGSAIGLALGLTALVVLAVAALSGRVPRAGRASGAVLLDPQPASRRRSADAPRRPSCRAPAPSSAHAPRPIPGRCAVPSIDGGGLRPHPGGARGVDAATPRRARRRSTSIAAAPQPAR